MFKKGDLVRFKRDTKYPGYQALQEDVMAVLIPRSGTRLGSPDPMTRIKSLVFGVHEADVYTSELELITDEIMLATFKWSEYLGEKT